MQRRNFLVGVGGAAIGGSALLGSGAFTRVESQRNVTIAVAADPDAYLGMSVIEESLNSTNYVDLDEKGHLFIDIGENPNGGQGVNSDSFTYFDDLFRLCNQGKADAQISYQLPEAGFDESGNWESPDERYDEPIISFYFVRDDGTRVFIEEGEEVLLEVGECDNIGLRTVTKSVNAMENDYLIDDEIVITADSPGAGAVGNGNSESNNS
ncbi:hypothetical protein [Halorubrum vacuolatum]|uniref:Uncharacterized protein n=1 Tax=Halorubrum vacuolatum TaxID=63740 RepID=A0A238X924_HALVU|nr:hypothetical protein [Halorubrum vacuolatum]SNR55112.1 hypothetical protein SAMN06264855_11476 [Halorubrum vacuolatum]